MDNETQHLGSSRKLWVTVPFVVVLVLWFATPFGVRTWTSCNDDIESCWAIWGQRGDMFGAVNALFSGLAFACLIVALGLQRRELSLQRQELRETTAALKGQEAALNKQNDSLQAERKEARFFRLLDVWRDSAGEVTASMPGSTFGVQSALAKLGADPRPTILVRGPDAFHEILRTLSGNYLSRLQGGEGKSQDTQPRAMARARALIAVDEFRKLAQISPQPALAAWFTALDVLNVYVLRTFKGAAGRNFYMNAIRSRLSGSEAAVYFYFAVSGEETRGCLRRAMSLGVLDLNLAKPYFIDGFLPEDVMAATRNSPADERSASST